MVIFASSQVLLKALRVGQILDNLVLNGCMGELIGLIILIMLANDLSGGTSTIECQELVRNMVVEVRAVEEDVIFLQSQYMHLGRNWAHTSWFSCKSSEVFDAVSAF